MNELRKEIIFFDNGSWNYVSKEVNRKTYQISYNTIGGFETYDLAEASYEADQKRFDKIMLEIKDATGIRFTFMSYLNYWFQEILTSYAYGSYQAGRAWVIYNLILPAVEKDLLLNMVTSTYINTILKKCAAVSKTAAVEARKTISIAMKDAIEDGYIQNNLMEGVDKYSSKIPKVVYYTKSQLKTLLFGAYEYQSIYLEVLLGVFCGLRPGEILGLKYSDFDFDEKTVDIKRQITRNNKVVVENGTTYKLYSAEKSPKPPKSVASYRTLRVPQVILDEVLKRKEYNKAMLKKTRSTNQKWLDYLCLGNSGEIKAFNTELNALKTICKRYNLPGISSHGLRHIYASILIEQGVALEKMSRLLGHKSVSTTLDIYCGIISALEQIREFVEDNLNPINAYIPQKNGKEGAALCQQGRR